jgi:hypothetical protein
MAFPQQASIAPLVAAAALVTMGACQGTERPRERLAVPYFDLTESRIRKVHRHTAPDWATQESENLHNPVAGHAQFA